MIIEIYFNTYKSTEVVKIEFWKRKSKSHFYTSKSTKVETYNISEQRRKVPKIFTYFQTYKSTEVSITILIAKE